MTAKQTVDHETTYNRGSLTRYAWLSIGAALLTITLKTIAYLMTGSVGLLSDAVESIANLVSAIVALAMLTIAARPPDDDHSYGHSKAEYLSSTLEGMLILVAAGGIIWAAVQRLLHPRPLEVLGVGIAITATASAVNFLVARVLLAQGRKRDSITLEADGQHLMTDVWTSAAVIAGLTIGAFTGLQVLDAILALLVGVNVIWTGLMLVSRSISGLMDSSLSRRDKAAIEAVIAQYRLRGVDFHALRTRLAASRRFVSVHILVPGAWSVHDAHHVAEDFENDIRTALGAANVFTHIEPQEDEISMDDVSLDR